MLKPVLNPEAVSSVIRLLESTRRTWEADVVRLLVQRDQIRGDLIQTLQAKVRERHKCRRCGHENT